MGTDIQIAGSMITMTMKHLEAGYSKAGYQAVLEALSHQDREVLLTTNPGQMVPFETFSRLLGAILSTLGRSNQEINFDIGRRVFHESFSTTYKVFLQFAPSIVFRLSVSAAWKKCCTHGELKVFEHDDKSTIIRLLDFSYRDPEFCGQRLRGGFVAIAEIMGYKAVRSAHTACVVKGDKFCEWQVHHDATGMRER